MRAVRAALLAILLVPAVAAARPYDEVEVDLVAAVREVRRLEARRASLEREARALEARVDEQKRAGGLVSSFTLPANLGDLHESWAEVERVDRSLAEARGRVDRLYAEAREVVPADRRGRLEVVSGRALAAARARLARLEAAERRGEADADSVAAARRDVEEARRAFDSFYR